MSEHTTTPHAVTDDFGICYEKYSPSVGGRPGAGPSWRVYTISTGTNLTGAFDSADKAVSYAQMRQKQRDDSAAEAASEDAAETAPVVRITEAPSRRAPGHPLAAGRGRRDEFGASIYYDRRGDRYQIWD